MKPDIPEPAPTSKITWGPVAAVIVTIGIYFFSQVIGSFFLLAIGSIHGWSQAQINQWVQEVFPQFVYIFLVEGVTLLLLWQFLKYRKASFRTIGLIKPKLKKTLGYTGLGFMMYFPVLLGAMALIQVWFPQINLNQQQQIGFTGAHGPQLILVFISLVVLPPFTEEILIRGFLYSGLKTKLPKIYAVLGTSLLFAAAHLEFGSGAPLLWSAAIDTFILSLVLIYLKEKTGNLWASIALHMIKNAIAFAALFIFGK